MKRRRFLGRKRGKNEKSSEEMGTFIFRKDERGVSEIALRFPCIF